MSDIQNTIHNKLAERQLNIFNSFVENQPKNDTIEKGGVGSGRHALSGHLSKLLSSVDKWYKNANNETQFISNLHATVMTITNNKYKHSDLSDAQKSAIRDKWLGLRNKR